MSHSTGYLLAVAAIAGGTLLTSIPASAAEPAIGDFLGRSEAEVSANLSKQGFDIEEVEHEHGEYRVDVKQSIDGNGTGWLEVHVDPVSGKILRVENDYRDQDSRYGRDDDGDRHGSREKDHDD